MIELTMAACDGTHALAMVEVFEQCTIIARYNDVSTYELVLPTSSEAAQVLMAATEPRLAVYSPTGDIFRSGPVIRFLREADAGGDFVTVNGVDDMVWLRRRVAHPQPGTAAPPYSSTATDTRTGAASQVIAGYVDRNVGAAAVTARRVPGFSVLTPTAFGGTVKTEARYENLLAFLQPIADAANVGMRVRDKVFECFQPTGQAMFSIDVGTLAAFASTSEAPESNYVYVGGSGEGAARLIREYASSGSVASWGRSETFVDQRGTSDTATLDQAGAEALASAVQPSKAQLDVVDLPEQQFLTDWNVGDLATVVLGDVVFTDVITEATVAFAANTPLKVTPAIGGLVADLTSFREMNSVRRRIRQLERI